MIDKNAGGFFAHKLYYKAQKNPPCAIYHVLRNAVINFDNLDLSLLEISHRSKNFIDVMNS